MNATKTRLERLEKAGRARDAGGAAMCPHHPVAYVSVTAGEAEPACSCGRQRWLYLVHEPDARGEGEPCLS